MINYFIIELPYLIDGEVKVCGHRAVEQYIIASSGLQDQLLGANP
jgi:hypothetical protein